MILEVIVGQCELRLRCESRWRPSDASRGESLYGD